MQSRYCNSIKKAHNFAASENKTGNEKIEIKTNQPQTRK